MPEKNVSTWGAPQTATETRLLHLLVEKLGGHSVDLTPVVDGTTMWSEPAKAGFSVGRGRSVRLEDIAAIFAPDPDHLRALAELVDLVVADTLGPSVEDEPDTESVGRNSAGPLAMTFGHVRRAQAAIKALMGEAAE